MDSDIQMNDAYFVCGVTFYIDLYIYKYNSEHNLS